MLKRNVVVATIAAIAIAIALAAHATPREADESGGDQLRPARLRNLYKSEFAILRKEGEQVRPAGMGFVIRQSPLAIMTCYHVVSEGNESNVGSIVYFIARRPDDGFEPNLTAKKTLVGLHAKRLVFKPEYDLAILEIDPTEDPETASKLELADSKPLTLNFESAQRALGTEVMWLTTAARVTEGSGVVYAPRVFFGNISASYTTNHSYNVRTPAGVWKAVAMPSIRMYEVDKVFVPGASGSPIVNAATGEVVGYVHGLHSIEIPSDTELRLALGLLRSPIPMITPVSLGVDVRSSENYLKESGYVPK